MHWNEFGFNGFVEDSDLSFIKSIRFVGTLQRSKEITIKNKTEKFRMSNSSLPSLCCDGPNVRDFRARKIGQPRIWRVESTGVSLETYKLKSLRRWRHWWSRNYCENRTANSKHLSHWNLPFTYIKKILKNELKLRCKINVVG